MEIDHLFVLCAQGAPEASALTELGFKEGSGNRHEGQGSACRRFFFGNAYLELMWVCDPAEAQTEIVMETGLWDRWSQRGGSGCPFGVILRGSKGEAPFASWSYRPNWLPLGLSIDVAAEVPAAEPAIFHMGFSPRRRVEPQDHLIPADRLTEVKLRLPGASWSQATNVLGSTGLVSLETADSYLMQLTFNNAAGEWKDLRPNLPLMLRW